MKLMKPANSQAIWHAMGVGEALEKLQTSRDGLQHEEAKRRLMKFGPNELVEKKKISPLKIFASQFKNFLILILLAAVAISAVIGEFIDAIVIFAIVIACAIKWNFNSDYYRNCNCSRLWCNWSGYVACQKTLSAHFPWACGHLGRRAKGFFFLLKQIPVGSVSLFLSFL
jgi:hypothetical protein